MFHVRAPKRLIVGMLVLAFGLVVVSAAAGSSGTSTSPLVIPYLSHGIGVDKSLYSGQSHQLRRASSSQSANQGPDVLERAVARQSADLNSYNYERTVAQAEAVEPQAVRPDDRAGVRGIESPEVAVAQAEAIHPQAVRPDDRAGTLGIGSSSRAQSSVSSSTDWSTILFGSGAGLAALLLAGWAIQFGRRQSGRVVTH